MSSSDGRRAEIRRNSAHGSGPYMAVWAGRVDSMSRHAVAVVVLVLVAVAAVAAGTGAAAPTPTENGSDAADPPGASLASGLGTTEASLDGTYRAATYRVRLADADSRADLEAVLAGIADDLDRDLERLSAEGTPASPAEARYRRAHRQTETAVLQRVSEQLAGIAGGNDALRSRFDRLAAEAATLRQGEQVNASLEIDVATNASTGPSLTEYGGLNASAVADLSPATRGELERVLAASDADALAELTASDLLSMDGEALLEVVDAGLIDLADYEAIDRETLANATAS